MSGRTLPSRSTRHYHRYISLRAVGAATSSAGGAMGSPTLVQRLIRDVLALPKFGLSKVEQAALKPVIDTCLPLVRRFQCAPDI